MVRICYNNLWKLLVDREINKAQLKEIAGIGTGKMAKLSKCEPVSSEIFEKTCFCLKCNIQDMMEFIYE